MALSCRHVPAWCMHHGRYTPCAQEQRRVRVHRCMHHGQCIICHQILILCGLITGPSGDQALQLLADPLGFLDRITNQYGPVVGLVLGGEYVAVVADAPSARTVLLDQTGLFVKVRTCSSSSLSMSHPGNHAMISACHQAPCCTASFNGSRFLFPCSSASWDSFNFLKKLGNLFPSHFHA